MDRNDDTTLPANDDQAGLSNSKDREQEERDQLGLNELEDDELM